VRRDWFDVLKWAVTVGSPFSTTDLALALPGAWRERCHYANGITQKLWKWGLLRKAVGPESSSDIEKALARALEARRSAFERGELTGVQGRAPSVWTVTPKGVRRAGKPRKRRS
jgi:hypothetical protein